jgi:sigma-B regulation protein RsbU (phosphoserine phosphatase)
MLLAYSDGISECRNFSGTEFGDDRVIEVARAAQGTPSSMLFTMLAAVEDFADGRPREDDFALMVIQRDRAARKAA